MVDLSSNACWYALALHFLSKAQLNKPLVIYLDQNKWIDLSRAYHQRADGKPYLKILEKLIDLVETGKVVLPLSSYHLMETMKAPDVSRRKRLAEVMAILSKGITIAPQSRMAEREILSNIATIFNKPVPPIPSAFGYGIPFAFGMVLVLKEIATAKPVEMPGQLIERIDNFWASRKIIESFLAGEDSESQNSLAIQHYETSSSDFILRAEKFRIDVKSYQGNDKGFHKRAYVGVLTLAIEKKLTIALGKCGKQFKDFLGLGQQQLMDFFETVPTLNTEIELVVERNQYWNRKIDRNDLADIAFLSVAIPYCDIVITEHFFGMSAKNCHLDQKYKTVILENLLDLPEYIP